VGEVPRVTYSRLEVRPPVSLVQGKQEGNNQFLLKERFGKQGCKSPAVKLGVHESPCICKEARGIRESLSTWRPNVSEIETRGGAPISKETQRGVRKYRGWGGGREFQSLTVLKKGKNKNYFTRSLYQEVLGEVPGTPNRIRTFLKSGGEGTGKGRVGLSTGEVTILHLVLPTEWRKVQSHHSGRTIHKMGGGFVRKGKKGSKIYRGAFFIKPDMCPGKRPQRKPTSHVPHPRKGGSQPDNPLMGGRGRKRKVTRDVWQTFLADGNQKTHEKNRRKEGQQGQKGPEGRLRESQLGEW